VSYFSKMKSSCVVVSLVALLGACGPERMSNSPRTQVLPLDPDVFYVPGESESEKFVDYASKDISACEWQSRLEKTYGSSTSTGRFRLFGSIEMRKPPKDAFNPLSVIGSLLSVVDFVMPWNIFRGIDVPNFEIRPWGRIDMRAHTLNSYAFLSEAEPQIPDRDQFLRKVDLALARRPTQYLKLLAFKAGLLTRTINAIEKRNEVVEEEISKVFPGLFSPDGTHDLLESFSWVLAQNGLRQKSGFKASDLEVYSRKLPVFRGGGWSALSEDMRLGLGAAIYGYRSGSPRERACAANIIFRSTDQLLHLMGQETLPLVELGTAQSYVPSLEGLLTSRDSTTIRRCNSVGSIVRGKARVQMDEKTLNRLSSVADRLDWNPKPLPLAYCKPGTSYVSDDLSLSSTGAPTKIADLLSRMDAFGHYLFAFNPGSVWWKQGLYPLGTFAGLKDIQDNLSLAPMRVHTLSLAFLQMNLIQLQNRHLVFLDENGVRTLNQDDAMAIRLSDSQLSKESPIATTSLASVLKFVSLLTKFDRYLKSIETWSRNSPSSTMVNGLFGSRANLQMLIGKNGENRKMIQKLYLASSLLLLKYVNREDPTTCHRQIVTDLGRGEEEILGDCNELRPALADSMRKLAVKLNSPLLQRSAESLDPSEE
jgi:hypothetical protein